MRRIEPAYPDLLPVTHVLRPGYMPGQKVSLDPIKLGVVWEDAPVRILPAEGSVPREPVRQPWTEGPERSEESEERGPRSKQVPLPARV